MAMMDTVHNGGYDGHKWHAAELLVAYYLADAGYCVSFPMIPAPYDLVAENGGALIRIQVKRAILKKQREAKFGKGDRERYSVDLKTSSKGRRSISEFDWICVVLSRDQVYVIPAEALSSPVITGSLKNNLIIKPPALNGRKDSIAAGEKWDRYLNNWDFKAIPTPYPLPLRVEDLESKDTTLSA